MVRTAAFPVLGRRVVVETDSPRLLELAHRTLSGWRAVEGSGPPLHVFFRVDGAVSERAGWVHQVRGAVYRGRGPGVRVEADRRLKCAWGRVSPHADPDVIARAGIECAALFLSTAKDRIPFHAAAVARRETACLLAGPSGVGKSTLIAACLDACLPVLAEDTVYFSAEGGFRIWGNPAPIRLGAQKTRVRVPPDRRVLSARRAVVCFLQRCSAAASRLESLPRETVLREIAGIQDRLFPGPEAAAVLRSGLVAGYRLFLGSDVQAAARQVATLADWQSA